MSTINREFFFSRVRISLFGGSLKQSQVDGITIFLDYWENNFAKEDDRWLAYMLGTAHHEVDRKMQPINEYGSNSYFFKMYDKDGQRPDVAKALGNKMAGDGVRYHGRGYVQITGRANYKRLGNEVGEDLEGNPELTLDSNIATKIIFAGMMKGLFTGKKLSGYFNANVEDWVQARRIVNRLDKANLIAGYAKDYYSAISYTTG